jgi:hypothetical protein
MGPLATTAGFAPRYPLATQTPANAGEIPDRQSTACGARVALFAGSSPWASYQAFCLPYRRSRVRSPLTASSETTHRAVSASRGAIRRSRMPVAASSASPPSDRERQRRVHPVAGAGDKFGRAHQEWREVAPRRSRRRVREVVRSFTSGGTDLRPRRRSLLVARLGPARVQPLANAKTSGTRLIVRSLR